VRPVFPVRMAKRRTAGRATTPVALAMVLAVVSCSLPTIGTAAPPRERVRARPPESWPALATATFFDDAFTTLEGARPDFGALAAGRAPGAAPATTPAASDGFRWSALVSAETLVDEVKDMRSAVQAAIASTTAFKGGGYESAREAFSSIALAFGVIAAYDGEVRWKTDAVAARDRFARVGFNCKVGTDQSFAEAKARATDLAALLDGSGLPSPSDGDPDAGDATWSQVAARPALMNRLDRCDATVNAAVASRADFNRDLARLLHEVEMAAVIAEVIQRRDYEYHDDDTYRGYAAAMRAAALEARSAAAKEDYDAVRAAVGTLKKSCDTCHGDYRS